MLREKSRKRQGVTTAEYLSIQYVNLYNSIIDSTMHRIVKMGKHEHIAKMSASHLQSRAHFFKKNERIAKTRPMHRKDMLVFQT